MPAAKQRTKPKVGIVFVKMYKQKRYTLKVVKLEGNIGFDLGGVVFSTPSRAAKSITKNEVNGWKFWKIRTE